mgnify:CR=1 FL=1
MTGSGCGAQTARVLVFGLVNLGHHPRLDGTTATLVCVVVGLLLLLCSTNTVVVGAVGLAAIHAIASRGTGLVIGVLTTLFGLLAAVDSTSPRPPSDSLSMSVLDLLPSRPQTARTSKEEEATHRRTSGSGRLRLYGSRPVATPVPGAHAALMGDAPLHSVRFVGGAGAWCGEDVMATAWLMLMSSLFSSDDAV